MASSFNLTGNPELERILRTSLPARRLLFIGGFALAAVLIIAGSNWSHYLGNDYLMSSSGMLPEAPTGL